MARDHRAIPVHREVLADLTSPVSIFLRCVTPERGFVLESAESVERWSRFSFVGRRPLATLVGQGGHVEVRGELPTEVPTDSGILGAVEHLLREFKSPRIEGLPPLVAGLVGYFGYDVVREVENLSDEPTDDRGYPDAVLDVIGDLAVFDHWRQRAVLIAVALLGPDASDAEVDAAYDDARTRLDQLTADGARPISEPLLGPPSADDELPDVQASLESGDFGRAVEAAKEYIRAGDIFQVVLSKRFSFPLEADPFDLYRVLRQVNPSPYMYFLQYPELSLAGCSPEPLVQVRDRRVISRPIAGTRRRGRTDADDRRMAAELIEDPKERAEHVMLVDLARNDLGRVVEYGSLEIEEFMTLEHYSHVMHLTSQVAGQLRDDRTVTDVLRATIPAGTVSGAPKVRAMEIIDELEPTKRGPYAGVVGYVDFTGNLDTAITIRTMVIDPDGTASVQAGAGVVADSQPEMEDLECSNKARALLSAVAAARRMTEAKSADGQ